MEKDPAVGVERVPADGVGRDPAVGSERDPAVGLERDPAMPSLNSRLSRAVSCGRHPDLLLKIQSRWKDTYQCHSRRVE